MNFIIVHNGSNHPSYRCVIGIWEGIQVSFFYNGPFKRFYERLFELVHQTRINRVVHKLLPLIYLTLKSNLKFTRTSNKSRLTLQLFIYLSWQCNRFVYCM